MFIEVVLNLCARHTSVPWEILRCAAELFGIFEYNQFVLQLSMHVSMRDLNALYPLDQGFSNYGPRPHLGSWKIILGSRKKLD